MEKYFKTETEQFSVTVVLDIKYKQTTLAIWDLTWGLVKSLFHDWSGVKPSIGTNKRKEN